MGSQRVMRRTEAGQARRMRRHRNQWIAPARCRRQASPQLKRTRVLRPARRQTARKTRSPRPKVLVAPATCRERAPRFQQLGQMAAAAIATVTVRNLAAAPATRAAVTVTVTVAVPTTVRATDRFRSL